ncbi:MAG: hypothetical protein D6730_22400 [Bacteroidetes bacterium]|nr:MAG: hypothetical protein D6730_22400 [Bacteroidota bacterium]
MPVLAAEVVAVWAGGLGPRSMYLHVQTDQTATLRLQLSQDSAHFSNPLYSPYHTSKGQDDYVVRIQLTGLQPNTTYFYRIEVNGSTESEPPGRFHTPGEGPYSFRFALGACMGGSSNRLVFETIERQNVLFFLHTGDMHYGNIADNCEQEFRQAFQDILSSPRQQALYRRVPLAYMWDDHDYGPNDSDAKAPCREVARKSYQRYVPHYPLAFGQGDVPISQSFVIGRVRFVLADLRSEKSRPVFEPNSCDKVQTGSNFGFQLDWFKEELLAAKQQGQVVAWVSGIPYINADGGPNYHCKEADNWGGYPEERREIADFIAAHDIPIMILGGDAHMTAIDDGSNSDYATGGGAPIPVFHAGSLDRGGSYKGGPYSHGYRKGGGQFGLVEITDPGGEALQVKWIGMNEQEEVLISEDVGTPLLHEFELRPAPPVTFPLDFVHAEALAAAHRVVLRWQTANELNLSHFVVERSLDQRLFQPLGRVGAGGQVYHFADSLPLRLPRYYRIKAVDMDGGLTYSRLLAVEPQVEKPLLTLFPNPSAGQFQLYLAGISGRVEVQVADMQGKTYHRQEYTVGGGALQLDMRGLPPQMYVLHCFRPGLWLSQPFVIHK